MSTDLNCAIVRIINKNTKQPLGSGFLISDQHIVTCAHIIEQYLCLKEDFEEEPTEIIYFDFPLLAEHPSFKAKILKCISVKDKPFPNQAEDIAILEIVSEPPLPHQAKPIKLFNRTYFNGQIVDLYGFPGEMSYKGQWIRGSLHGMTANGKVQIDTELGREKIAPGFSGTAVWDIEEKAVIGIVSRIHKTENDVFAYMIPVSQLIDIFPQIKDLNRPVILSEKLNDLIIKFSQSPLRIRDSIIDYIFFIDEKTQDFVGRHFIFDAFSQFQQNNPRGYFIVRGDPGIGKSSILAEVVKKQAYVHHFNIRTDGINRTSKFLTNICAQLIAAYNLNYYALPPETTQDANFLSKLLREISDNLIDNEKLILVIDALDEVDSLDDSSGANILYLPSILPDKVYIFMSSRRKDDIKLRLNCPYEYFDIDQNSIENIADIRAHITTSSNSSDIEEYIKKHSIDKYIFIDQLTNKSQGNFIYLHYVIPEIRKGSYHDLDIKDIPSGLQNYYKDHWFRMKTKDEGVWFNYKLPAIIALTIVNEPISIDLIQDFSKVTDRQRIHAVLIEWDQFLYKLKTIDQNNAEEIRYRMYHESFHDFLASKEEIADEHVNFKSAHRIIADNLWGELGL